MRKSFVGVFAVVGLALVCSSSEAKPKRKEAPPPAATPAPTPTAGEWSLQDQKYWTNLQEEMDAAVKRANDQCKGTTIKGGFDKESFRGHLTEGGSYGLASGARSHCLAGPSAIETICTVVNYDEASAKTARETVKAKVVNIQCRWGGKGKQAMSFADKKLTTTIDIEGEDNGASYAQKVTDFMKQKL